MSKKEQPGQEEEAGSRVSKKVLRKQKQVYRKELAGLQVRLGKLQEWVNTHDVRLAVVLEGLGPAGKRGTARRIDESLQKHFSQIVSPTASRKRSLEGWELKRFKEHMPKAGRIVIFDGSWYHAPAMRYALGLMDKDAFDAALQEAAAFEQELLDSGIRLVKYWFGANSPEQDARFRDHVAELRQEKVLRMPEEAGEPVPVAQVQAAVLAASNLPGAPWQVIDASDKRAARLACMSHLRDLTKAALEAVRSAKPKG